MGKTNSKTQGNKRTTVLDDLFLELFTPEFLEELPHEEIEQTISNIRTVESNSEVLPPQWQAMKNTLRVRGFMK